jgi:hypothetical protein
MGSSRISPASISQILYLSQLDRDAGFTVVKDIVRASRAHNRSRGITGALLFDGERFCQLLEGGEGDLDLLMQRIERDVRHGAIRILHRGAAGARALRSWRSGYCESANDLDPFDGDNGLAGPAAVQRFVTLAHAADLD